MTGLCVLPHDQPAETWIGLLCRRHRDRLDRDVDEIAALIIDASRIRDGGAPSEPGARGQHQKKRADPPPPGDVRLMAMFDKRTKFARLPPTEAEPEGDQTEPVLAVLNLIAANVLLLAEERPLTETRTRLVIRQNRIVGWHAYTAPMRLPQSALGQLALLRRHHDWIACQDWAEVYVDELTDMRKALASAVADHPVTRVGTCHLTIGEDVCGGALLRENGSSAVTCRQCGASWVTAQQIARLAVGE